MNGPAGLRFAEAEYHQLRQLCEEAYPFEGCGVLIGRPTGSGTEVIEVLPGTNLVTDRRHDRYELDPKDIISAERRARELGLEVVGFYHTHPDHPAHPSQYDTDRAWPSYHYVVVAVAGGKLERASAWRLEPEVEPNRFVEVPLISPGAGRGYNPPGLVAEAS